MTKVVVTIPGLPHITQLLHTVLGPETEVVQVNSLDRNELIKLAADAQVLLTVIQNINSELLAQLPQLQFVQQLGAGYNNLNLADLKQAGIKAANTPGSNSEAVAEMTILLMLAVLRQIGRTEQTSRANKWSGLAIMNQFGFGDLAGSTVGLIGLGAIGQATARRLKAFQTKLIYTSRKRADVQLEQELGLEYKTLPELLASAQIVSLHLPLSAETRGLIGEAELAQMQPGSILVNTARGAIVDEVALRKAIEEGHLAGAGLDVLEHETDDGNPFTDLPQVIVTPHVSGLTRAATTKTFQMAIDNIGRFVSGEKLLYLLNE